MRETNYDGSLPKQRKTNQNVRQLKTNETTNYVAGIFTTDAIAKRDFALTQTQTHLMYFYTLTKATLSIYKNNHQYISKHICLYTLYAICFSIHHFLYIMYFVCKNYLIYKLASNPHSIHR